MAKKKSSPAAKDGQKNTESSKATEASAPKETKASMATGSSKTKKRSKAAQSSKGSKAAGASKISESSKTAVSSASEQLEEVKSSESAEIVGEVKKDKRITDQTDQVYREQTLDFASLSSELTIEEVQEEAQILEEENLSTESPLDRYVRRHREEVETAKNSLGDSAVSAEEEITENSVSENIEGDDSQTAPQFDGLDPVAVAGADADTSIRDFEALEGEIVDTSIFPAPTLSEIYESQLADEKKFDSVSVAPSDPETEAGAVPLMTTPKRSERFAATSAARSAENDFHENLQPDEKEKKTWKKPLVLGLAAIIILGIAGYAGTQIYNNNKQAAAKTETSKTASKISAFNKDYEAFFTDSSHNVLKNSNFDKISGLGDDLNAIPVSDSRFTALQTKYNNLSNDISAIKSVNGIFNKPVITDGNFDDTVTVKDGINVPNVSSKNTTLNALLAKAVSLAKSQQDSAVASSASASASSSAAADDSNGTAPSSSGTANTSNASTTESSPAITDNTTAADSVYSQNPTGAAPDNSGSRVPVQSIDPNSAAFQWASGVLDQTIATMQSRGYISGSNYILTPVAVDTAGEGWYNIYRPDGSYLFSINCKTGFWAGAGGKYPNLPATF
ncbi:cell division site-positioning protein MapZ family protein [Lactovum odontotermitis]